MVEPKKKSQEPAAKAKRTKRLLANPGFAEAVSEERAAAKMWEEAHDNLHHEYMAVMKEQGKEQDNVIDNVVLQNDYIEQLKENNKHLHRAVAITTQFEMIEILKRYIKAQDEMLERNQKAKHPNRVTGGKRSQPKGSKSKAVSFGADAMPDRDLVPFGSRAEVAAALM